MSRWHRENPEHYEMYGEPDWRGQADRIRKERRESDMKPWDAKNERPLQPCVNCGEPSRSRWCSSSCFYSEDRHE